MEPAGTVALESLLRTLASNTRVIGAHDKAITNIAIDSRQVEPGALFVALRGEHTDGHRFIAQAAQRGAAAIVMEELCEVPQGVTAIVVPDTARAISSIADAFYGSPSKRLIVAGITGTNGKTTASRMTASMLEAGGIPAGIIGTIGAQLGEREWPLANTTPLAPQLHALLEEMRSRGARGVAMEVSSHALALQRVADIHFAVGALTNVTRDHLDFHKSFEAYAAAKRHLFDLAARAVLNADDELGDRWSRELRARKPVITYALHGAADLRAESLDVRAGGSSFRLGGQHFEVRLPGRFNVANALCAIGVARSLGIADADAAHGLASLDRVAGRMDHVSGGGVDVVVDYAHTPDALENVLRTLRETARQRLIAVFGCGGDRDRGKRPQMGAAAAKYADFTIVTSDNPRTENPQAIIEQIVPGLQNAPHAIEPERRAAIENAIRDARAGDVVLIAGKGHENFQIVGAEVLPFDDLAVAKEALARKAPAPL